MSSPQRTTKTMASLPLISWRTTPSIRPSSSRGSSRLGIFIRTLAAYLAVRLEQPLVDRAALEVAAQRGQPEEALILVEQRECLLQRLAAVHQGQRGLEGAGFVELGEIGDAAIDLETRFASLAVLRDPGAALKDGFVVAEREREQQFQFADA